MLSLSCGQVVCLFPSVTGDKLQLTFSSYAHTNNYWYCILTTTYTWPHMVSVLWLMRDDFSRFFKSCKKKWWVPGDWYYWQIRVLGWVSIRSERSIDTIFPLDQSGIQQKKEHLHVSHFPLRAREARFWWFIEKGFSVCQSLWIWALCSHLHIFRHVGLLCWETQWFITSPTRLPCEAVSFTVSTSPCR